MTKNFYTLKFATFIQTILDKYIYVHVITNNDIIIIKYFDIDVEFMNNCDGKDNIISDIKSYFYITL